jgi:hypothetical protein
MFDSVTIMAVIRHLLTFVGGVLVSLGWLDESTMQQLAGSLATVAGLLWSVWDKWTREKVTSQ